MVIPGPLQLLLIGILSRLSHRKLARESGTCPGFGQTPEEDNLPNKKSSREAVTSSGGLEVRTASRM